MTGWIRADASLPDHRKTVALEQRLGVEDGWRYPQRLWWWCLEHRDNGVIGQLPTTRLAEVAHWRGDPEIFRQALVEVGFLDEDERGLVVHDWMDHQGTLFRDRERKRRARAADSPRIVRGLSADSPAPTVYEVRKTKRLAAQRSAAGDLVLTPPGGNGGKGRRGNPDVRALVGFYAAEVKRVKGFPPVVRHGSAEKSFQALLAGRTLEQAKAVVSAFLEDPPTFYRDKELFDPEAIAKAANTILARAHQ